MFMLREVSFLDLLDCFVVCALAELSFHAIDINDRLQHSIARAGGPPVHLHIRPSDLPVPLPAHALDASANPKPHGQLCGDHFLGDGLCAGSHLLKRHKLEDAER